MANPTQLPGDLRVPGDITYSGNLHPAPPRSALAQENNAVYPIPIVDWRVWDAMHTNLPGTGATDDLALVGGTFGTGVPSIQTGDVKNLGATTRYARCLVQLPPEYVAGESVTIRVNAGMVTTIASTSATIDFEVFKSNRGVGVDGTDLSTTTAATTINSLTFANKDFIITATSLNPGDILDIRMAIAVSDTATGTAVIGCAGSVELLLDIKG